MPRSAAPVVRRQKIRRTTIRLIPWCAKAQPGISTVEILPSYNVEPADTEFIPFSSNGFVLPKRRQRADAMSTA
jgi:hypothetical protein